MMLSGEKYGDFMMMNGDFMLIYDHCDASADCLLQYRFSLTISALALAHRSVVLNVLKHPQVMRFQHSLAITSLFIHGQKPKHEANQAREIQY
jgi:hypothetical protein